ncbi:unnamed protein product [Paramecium octaurelia]|uniref:Uncharacterized protein n=1 Tax=Paramecium octaurelia TaxID=43137 RepID=A0A8S1WLQ3_PAROT|nr:unnamed protein product [Paramecium octaurelia]
MENIFDYCLVRNNCHCEIDIDKTEKLHSNCKSYNQENQNLFKCSLTYY